MQQYLEQLAKIYNTLTLVSTKGEDTIVMGQCLSAMHEVLINIQESITADTNKIESVE